jgi:Glyoxalase-like domain
MPIVQRKAVSVARSQVRAAIHSVVRSSIARFRRCRARSDSAMAHESSFGRPPRVHDRRLFAGKRGLCRPLVGEDCRWSRAARISNPGRSSSSTMRSSCRALAQSLGPLCESRWRCWSPGPFVRHPPSKAAVRTSSRFGAVSRECGRLGGRTARRVCAAVRIDRVIVAATDLDAAAARLEGEHGLRAAGGGRHEGHRTHNRIVSLGGGYLEILAVVDAAEGLMGWAVAVDDVVPVAERLGTRRTRSFARGSAPNSPVSWRRSPGRACRSSSRAIRESRIPAAQAIPVVSSKSRWPAIPTSSMLG